MSARSGVETRGEITRQATCWLLTLQSEELTTAQRGEFVDWLRESPLHISEILHLCQLQRGLSRFEGWPLIAAMEEAPESKFIQFPVAPEAAGTNRSGHRRRGVWLLAAVVAAAGVIGLLMLARLQQTEYRTQPGERRELTLADGSQIDLAPDSDVAVRYRRQERLIRLDHGEALFHVARNPSRPFIVQAALTQVRAVGTVFSVERGAQGVSVTVVEGSVAVTQQSPASFGPSALKPAPPVLSLTANEQVSINLAGRASAVHGVQGVAKPGSATDQLTFEDETIAEIASRFNLHNRLQIEITDSKLAAQRISGVFQANDPQSFIAFIQAVADTSVLRPDPMHIILSPTGRR